MLEAGLFFSYSGRQAIDLSKSEHGGIGLVEGEKRKNGIKGIQQNHQIMKN
ncbi:MAG TPA: hypothetical protein PKY20_01605 [Methanothrix sp.]|nr:hypothetical protein [Methanothrix sp.]